MRKTAICRTMTALCLLGMLAQPLLASAQDNRVVERSKSEMTYTNPVTELVLLPVRLVTGALGAPIGAVAGLFVGFGKGFNWPGHAATMETTTTTTTKD